MKASRQGTLLASLPANLSYQRPKGEQLQEILEGFIATLEPGTRLPSERLLAERYEVARATVTQAIDELAGKGLVYRVHGSGTFVAEPKFRQPQTLTSFTEDMRARGMTPGSIVLAQEVAPASAVIARHLQVVQGTPSGSAPPAASPWPWSGPTCRLAASRVWRRPTSPTCRCTRCSPSAGGRGSRPPTSGPARCGSPRRRPA